MFKAFILSWSRGKDRKRVKHSDSVDTAVVLAHWLHWPHWLHRLPSDGSRLRKLVWAGSPAMYRVLCDEKQTLDVLGGGGKDSSNF